MHQQYGDFYFQMTCKAFPEAFFSNDLLYKYDVYQKKKGFEEEAIMCYKQG